MILGGKYFKLSNAVFCYGLTPIKLSVYSYLVSCAGQREKCWPAMKTIAACCGCSKNAARDAVTELVKRGFIRKVETFKDELNGRNRQTNNTYYTQKLRGKAVNMVNQSRGYVPLKDALRNGMEIRHLGIMDDEDNE